MSLTKPVKEQALNSLLMKLFAEELDLTQQESRLITELQKIQERKSQILNERELLESIGKQDDLDYTEVTTSETTKTKVEYDEKQKVKSVEVVKEKVEKRTGRFTKNQALDCEMAIGKILKDYGRPIKLSVLIDELANVGYKWNKYVTAAAFIMNRENVESPARGFYQLKRVK